MFYKLRLVLDYYQSLGANKQELMRESFDNQFSSNYPQMYKSKYRVLLDDWKNLLSFIEYNINDTMIINDLQAFIWLCEDLEEKIRKGEIE